MSENILICVLPKRSKRTDSLNDAKHSLEIFSWNSYTEKKDHVSQKNAFYDVTRREMGDTCSQGCHGCSHYLGLSKVLVTLENIFKNQLLVPCHWSYTAPSDIRKWVKIQLITDYWQILVWQWTSRQMSLWSSLVDS